MSNPNIPSHEQLPPQQGQVINFALPSANSAEQHMQNLGEMIAGPDFRAGFNTKAHPAHPERNEDTVYMGQLADGSAVMGLFDGVGHGGKGDIASRAAREELHDKIISGELNGADRQAAIEELFESMAARVASTNEECGTTATLAIIGPAQADGSRIVDWAAVGDSPLFYYDSETKQVVEVTHEESVRQNILDTHAELVKLGKETRSYEEVVKLADSKGNEITNALASSMFEGLAQKGQFLLPRGAKLLLASDGITGDKSTQRLDGGDSNERVISEVLSRSKNVKQMAYELIQRAVKPDDQTALIYENHAEVQKPVEEAPKNPESNQSLAEKLGVVDFDFRVMKKDKATGNMLTWNAGFKVTGIGTMTEKATGNRVPAVELKTRMLKNMNTGENVQESVTVPLEKFMQWQKDKAEEKRLREASEQNDLLAAQVQKGVEARAVLQTAPSTAELDNHQGRDELPAERLLHAVGYQRFQKIYVPRPDEGVYVPGQILSAKIDGRGMVKISVVWSELDPKTGDYIDRVRLMTPVEVAEAQNKVLEGDVRVRGSGQTVQGI